MVVGPEPNVDLAEQIDRLQAEYQFVIIDVQGTANLEIIAAMSRADLVLIPVQAMTADAQVATRAIKLLRTQESMFKRKIPHSVVFVRTNTAIATREEKQIRQNIKDAGLPFFTRGLNQRTAFSHMIAHKLVLIELNPEETNGLDAAVDNAYEFTAEVIALLRKHREMAA